MSKKIIYYKVLRQENSELYSAIDFLPRGYDQLYGKDWVRPDHKLSKLFVFDEHDTAISFARALSECMPNHMWVFSCQVENPLVVSYRSDIPRDRAVLTRFWRSKCYMGCLPVNADVKLSSMSRNALVCDALKLIKPLDLFHDGRIVRAGSVFESRLSKIGWKMEADNATA